MAGKCELTKKVVKPEETINGKNLIIFSVSVELITVKTKLKRKCMTKGTK
jgi:hypothetical protein